MTPFWGSDKSTVSTSVFEVYYGYLTDVSHTLENDCGDVYSACVEVCSGGLMDVQCMLRAHRSNSIQYRQSKTGDNGSKYDN